MDNMKARYRNMIMCHMMADTVDELHAMADKIGVVRRHFQDTKYKHYDICLSKRILAVRYGAIELDAKELVRMFRGREVK